MSDRDNFVWSSSRKLTRFQRNESSTDGWEEYDGYRAPSYAPPKIVVLLGSTTPRFGHSNKFAHLVSIDAAARKDYKRGLAAFAGLILALVLAWGAALFFLMLRGRFARRRSDSEEKKNRGGRDTDAVADDGFFEKRSINEETERTIGTAAENTCRGERIPAPGIFCFNCFDEEVATVSNGFSAPASAANGDSQHVDLGRSPSLEPELDERGDDGFSPSRASTISASTMSATQEGNDSWRRSTRSCASERHGDSSGPNGGEGSNAPARSSPPESNSPITSKPANSNRNRTRRDRRERRARRRRVQNARLATLCFGSALCLGSVILLLFGASSLKRVRNAVGNSVADARRVVFEMAAVVASFSDATSEVEMARKQCVWKDCAFCPTPDGTALGLDVKAISRSVTDQLEYFDSFMRENATGLENSVVTAEEMLNGVASALTKSEKVTWVIPSFLLALCAAGVAFTGGTLWESRKGSAGRAQKIMSQLIVPIFILLISGCWTALIVVSVGSMINNDACTGGEAPGSPDATVIDILHELHFEPNSNTYNMVKSYTGGCVSGDPMKPLLEFEAELKASAGSVWDALLQIDSVRVTELGKECGSSFEGAVQAAQVLATSLDTVLNGIQRTKEMMRCDRINPIYINAVHNSVCSDMAYGLSVSFFILLTISICGMIIISLRNVMTSQRRLISVNRNRDASLPEHEEYLRYISKYKHEWDDYPGIDASSVMTSDIGSVISDVLTLNAYDVQDLEQLYAIDESDESFEQGYEGCTEDDYDNSSEEEDNEEGTTDEEDVGDQDSLCAIHEHGGSSDQWYEESHVDEFEGSTSGSRSFVEERLNLGLSEDNSCCTNREEHSLTSEDIDVHLPCVQDLSSSSSLTSSLRKEAERVPLGKNNGPSLGNSALSGVDANSSVQQSAFTSEVEKDRVGGAFQHQLGSEEISSDKNDVEQGALVSMEAIHNEVDNASLGLDDIRHPHQDSFSSQIEGHTVRCVIRGLFGMQSLPESSLERRDYATGQQDVPDGLLRPTESENSIENMPEPLRSEFSAQVDSTVQRAAAEIESQGREMGRIRDGGSWPFVTPAEENRPHRRTPSGKLRHLIIIFENQPKNEQFNQYADG